MSKLIETKAIRKILSDSFPDYVPSKIENVLDDICNITGRVDYRSKYVEMVEGGMDRIEKLRKEKP